MNEDLIDSEDSFTYDLERMKIVVESESIKMPENIETFEDFKEWLETV